MESERLLLNEQTPWWGEHVHRYQTVVGRLNGAERILDLACGTGYGTAMLAGRSGAQVIGGDIDSTVIPLCQARWTERPNLEFKVLDGTALPFKDGEIEVVVSFETIEHTRDFEKMISEFSRVLKPGGVAYISTPNQEVSSPDGIIHNQYHTQEFSLSEFQELTRSYFKGDCEYWGQAYLRYAEDSHSLRRSVASMVEAALYLRGIRKLPLPAQDRLMHWSLRKPMYPTLDDYGWVVDEASIRKRCRTQMAICRNKLG